VAVKKNPEAAEDILDAITYGDKSTKLVAVKVKAEGE